MTPEDILADLRDLQLPPPVAGNPDVAFVWWPLIVFALAAGALIWLALRRRHAWRKEALAVLNEVESDVASEHFEAAWTRLAVLLRQLAIIARGQSLAASVNGEAWLALLDDIFASDLFCSGPGRSLLSHPYQVDAARSAARQDGDLVRIVTFVRRNLRRITPA